MRAGQMHGAYTARRALEAGVLDELQIHQIPVLFGAGRRLFEVLPSRIELEIVGVIDTPDAAHIRYRVRRCALTRLNTASVPPGDGRLHRGRCVTPEPVRRARASTPRQDWCATPGLAR